MDWTKYAALLAVFIVPAVVVGIGTLVGRWSAGLTDPVDALIERNRYRARANMDQQDRQKTDRAGAARWQEVQRAQRKLVRQKAKAARAAAKLGGVPANAQDASTWPESESKRLH